MIWKEGRNVPWKSWRVHHKTIHWSVFVVSQFLLHLIEQPFNTTWYVSVYPRFFTFQSIFLYFIKYIKTILTMFDRLLVWTKIVFNSSRLIPATTYETSYWFSPKDGKPFKMRIPWVEKNQAGYWLRKWSLILSDSNDILKRCL